MADEVREYVRAAQEAEVRGDVGQAIEHLRKAATLYRTRGNTARALQMLRHARRLDGTRQDIIDEINRLEWLPEQPMQNAVSGTVTLEPSDELKAELEKLLKPLDEAEVPGADKQMFERGPTKADPTLSAWCSFCCKPKKEVGELVAGPAGAFVCASCVFESARLLAVPLVQGDADGARHDGTTPTVPRGDTRGHPDREEPQPAKNTDTRVIASTEESVVAAAQRVRPATSFALPFSGQRAAVRQVEAALRRGARVVLLMGPEGSGKSAYLAELEARGIGTRVGTLRRNPPGADARSATVLLVDDFASFSAEERATFAARVAADESLSVILSVRGDAPTDGVTLLSDDGPLVVHSTRSLLSGALQDLFPPTLVELIDAVAVFEPLSVADLRLLAQRFAERRASDLDLSEDVLDALVELAAKSGRGGRELEALIRRIPPGSWTLPPAPAKAKKPRKKP